ncbi:MAG: hypothetical protein V7767_05190 [Leeuwenhoekiella sp.]
MPRDIDLQQRKRQTILQYFQELDTAKEYGVKKHTTVWCIAKTADRFFLAPRSIERYIYGI